jgi:hypothetical protein
MSENITVSEQRHFAAREIASAPVELTDVTTEPTAFRSKLLGALMIERSQLLLHAGQGDERRA